METLKKNLINMYGPKAKQWLDNLPAFIKKLETQHKLSHLKPVNNLSYNYVLSGYQDTQPIILKLSLDVESLKQEADALRAFSDFGVAPLLLEEEGLIIQTHAVPGVSLKSFFPDKEEESIHIAAHCMKQLHQAPLPRTHHFKSIEEWLSALDKDWDIPDLFLKKTRQLRDELLKQSDKPILLHGDLHHDNILQDKESWIIIDPKGVLGEPAYEVGAFIRNPIPGLLKNERAHDIIQNRIMLFSQLLNIPPHKIAGWALVQAVLAWVWALEDKGETAYWEKLTQILFYLS